jgi:hypothetical protein
MESRGKLITVARCRPGEMCSTITVSERWPASVRLAPNLLFAPARLSEPISRMFSALVYFGGRFPRPVILTRWMLSTTFRYSA